MVAAVSLQNRHRVDDIINQTTINFRNYLQQNADYTMSQTLHFTHVIHVFLMILNLKTGYFPK